MTNERDFDRLARAWLELGPNEAPDRVIDAVLQATETSPQVRRPIRWLTWRPNPMNRYPLAAVAAAIVVVVIGGAILLNQRSSSGIGGGPSAAPTPSPTASPVPLSRAVAAELTAGRYSVTEPYAVPFSLTVPSGWTLKTLTSGDAQFLNTGVNGGDGAAWIVVDIVDNVFADPCHANNGPIQPRIPPTVDAIVSALTGMVGFSAGPITDVVVGDHAGKVVELTNAIDTDAETCSGGAMLQMWTTNGGQNGATNGGPNDGATDRLWVIDVGGTPVIINGETFSETPDTSRAVIEQIVQSMTFE